MDKQRAFLILFFSLLGYLCWGQDLAYNDGSETPYQKAHDLAYVGKHKPAKDILLEVLAENPNNLEARGLLASTYSWDGDYAKARDEFNTITSKRKNDRGIWVSAIKNELYARNDATAFGLANKALSFLEKDSEVERLKLIAEERITNKKYPEKGWFNQKSTIQTTKNSKSKKKSPIAKKEPEVITADGVIKPKNPADKEVLNNRLAIRNSFTVFDQRYDPMVYSSVSFKRQTLAGSIIPRINYSNRLGKHGLQYDLDFYPKFSKRFYA